MKRAEDLVDMHTHSSVGNTKLSGIVNLTQKYGPSSRIQLQRGDLVYDSPNFVVDQFDTVLKKMKKTKYPKSGGELALKKAVVMDLQREGHFGLGENNVTITYGGQDGLFSLCARYRGKNIAAFSPVWTCMLDNMIPYNELNLTTVPLEERNGELTFSRDKLDRALKGAHLFYLNNPHNPTGKVFSKEEVKEISSICRENDALLISDEAYKDIVFDGKKHFSAIDTDNDYAVSVFTFSKIFGTGYRVGYTVSRNPKILENLALINYTFSAGVATNNQHAFALALEEGEKIKNWKEFLVGDLQEKRDSMDEILRGTFSDMPKPQGAFYFYPRLALPNIVESKSERIFQKILERGVLVAPGPGFGEGQEEHLRLSYSMSDKETLREGAKLVTEAYADLKREAA